MTTRVARSEEATRRRLTTTVEIVRVQGPDADHLAQVQLEAIKEVLAWTTTQHDRTQHMDRAA